MLLQAMFMSDQIIQAFSSTSHATEEDLLAAITNRVAQLIETDLELLMSCLLYTSPSPRDKRQSRMPSSA